jgi:alkylation response protein AidB-like acyl-CoA dehydrogenase
MDFNYTDEQRMLMDTARRYVRECCSLEGCRTIARSEEGFSRERWARFTEMGWLALPLPEDFGGLGGSSVDVALLMEELGRGLVIEPIVDAVVLCGSLLSHTRATECGRVLAEGLATGEVLPVLAHIEGGGRSEFETAVESSARRTVDGWVLSGVKHRVPYAAAASHLLVTARVDGASDFGVFVVPADSARLMMQSLERIDGGRMADVHFDHVVLSSSAMLLNGEHAPGALEAAFDRAIIAQAAAAIGSMEVAMTMTAEYLKTRVQYGQPLARFQALQHRMAEMFVETDQAHAALFRGLAALEGDDEAERARVVSAAKWLVARAGLFVTGQAIQLHGGIGVTDEYAVGHHYKRLVSFDKYLGDAEFHLQRSNVSVGRQ